MVPGVNVTFFLMFSANRSSTFFLPCSRFYAKVASATDIMVKPGLSYVESMLLQTA